MPPHFFYGKNRFFHQPAKTCQPCICDKVLELFLIFTSYYSLMWLGGKGFSVISKFLWGEMYPGIYVMWLWCSWMWGLQLSLIATVTFLYITKWLHLYLHEEGPLVCIKHGALVHKRRNNTKEELAMANPSSPAKWLLTHWPLKSLPVILLGFARQRALQYNRDIQCAESRLWVGPAFENVII